MKVQRHVVFAVVVATVVSTGWWFGLRASVPQVAAGTWVPAGGLGGLPQATAAAALADGRLVIGGGRNADGTLTSQIGIYDPASGSWENGGQLAMARAGHTATALQDGRVLFAGGTTVNGVAFDVEIYNPGTHQSVHIGDMWVPRVNHAAAQMLDGTVLIVGGSDGLTVLNYAERFNPDTGETQSLTAVLDTAREGLTATTMLDGHVLVAGGRNSSGDLAIAELFIPGNQLFIPTGPLHAARSGHAAVLLPNNNQVLIAGGSGGGTSAELYADWRDGFTVAPNGMSQARIDALGGGLKPYDLAIVAGASSGSAEYFGYATVKTDRDDYWPGETVTITGSGWQPGETVTLKISEDADTHNDFTYSAVADQNGNIVNRQFAPIEDEVFHHFGMRFYLTATGAASTALNTFTDGNSSVIGVVTNSVTGLPVSGASVNCTAGCNGSQPTVTTNATGNYTLTVNFPGNSATVTVTVSAPGYDTLSQQVDVANTSPNFTKNFALVPTSVSTSTAVSSSQNPSIYGGSVTFTAAITPSTATGSVQFRDGASDLGSPVTVAGGQAALATSELLAGSHSITAVFTGTGTFGSSTSPALTQQVNQKLLTVTATNQSKVYGAAVTPAGTEFTSSGLIGTDTVTGVTLSSTGYAASASVAASPHAITPSAAVGVGLSNYAITYAPGTMTVTARPIAVSADPKTKVYGAADPELSYQLTSGSLVAGDSFSGALSRATGENVGTYSIQQGSLTLGTNYDITFTAANLSITPATLAVTAQPQSKEYGNNDPALTYLTGGLQFTDTAASVLSGFLARVPGESVAGGPYPIGPGTLAANSNYTIAFVPAMLSITPATLAVTAEAKTKQYGEVDPPLTYISSGYKFTDTAATVLSGLLQRAPGESVLGGPYAIGKGTLAANTNYTIAFTAAALSITTKPASVTPEAAGKEYGSDDPALTGALLGFLAGDNVTASYSRTAGETVQGSPYTISATLSPAGVLSNYAITYSTANFTITAKTASVTPNAAGKEYGSDDPALTGTLVGFLAGDNVTASYSRTAGETVQGGPYTISATLLPVGVLSNYAITYSTANFTITAKTASVTPEAAGKEYGSDDPALTGALVGFLAGDNVSATYSRTAGETVQGGPYTISATLLPVGVLSNYAITYNTASFTITAKTASVTPNAAGKEYGSDDPALTGALVGFLAGDNVTATYSRTVGETVQGGPYTISATLQPAGVLSNYAITYNTALFTITAKPLTVTANNASKTYGQPTPPFSYTAPGLKSGDSLGTPAYLFEGYPTVPTDAGTYVISVTGLGNPNYSLSFATGSYVINQATPAIYWNPPADITYPTALSSTQLNATANVPGAFVYSPASGVVLNANPAQTLHVDFTPTDTRNYTNAAKNVLINVLKGSQVITFGALAHKTFGDPPVPVSATGGASGQPVTFSSTTPAVCGAAPNGPNAANVTIHAVGQCTVRASQDGTPNYHAAQDVDRSFLVASWTAQGFHQPVGISNSVFAPTGIALLPAPPATAGWNSAKGGQTIPLKFNLFAAGVERTSTTDIVGFVARPLTSCSATGYEDPLEVFETAGATVLRYDGVAGSGQFIQNWKTPTVKGEQCFRVELTFRDLSVLYTFVKLKK